MYDCQSLSIRQYQKLHIILVLTYIVSQTTQGSKLQMFFSDSLGEVTPRKNELYFMGNLTPSIGEK